MWLHVVSLSFLMRMPCSQHTYACSAWQDCLENYYFKQPVPCQKQLVLLINISLRRWGYLSHWLWNRKATTEVGIQTIFSTLSSLIFYLKTMFLKLNSIPITGTSLLSTVRPYLWTPKPTQDTYEKVFIIFRTGVAIYRAVEVVLCNGRW